MKADGGIMPPYQPAVRGRDAIRDWHADVPPVTEVEVPNADIGGSGDVAFVRGTYTLTILIEGAFEQRGAPDKAGVLGLVKF